MSVTDDQKYEALLALVREIRAIVGVPPKVWLTPEEAAAYLGISKSRVYQYVREGTMPAHYLPHSNLIRMYREELDTWIRAGRHNADELSTNTIGRLLK